MQGDLKGISERAQTLLANLNDVTGPANRRQIAEILQQVNSLVAKESPKIDRIADQVTLVTQDADSVVNKIGPLVDHTDAAVGNVNLTIDSPRSYPARLSAVAIHDGAGQDLLASLQTLVRSNDDNIHETIENMRVATENLDELTDQVKQRPWSLVRIRQPKDRKVPK